MNSLSDEVAALTALFPAASSLASHDAACCSNARAALLARDILERGSKEEKVPDWLRLRYDWGPTRWPLYWCDLTDKKACDCGALAAICTVLLNNRSETVRAAPLQMILRYPVAACAQWRALWESRGASSNWVADGLCYHEGCALLLTGGVVNLWDPTETIWRLPSDGPPNAVGAIAALRIQATPGWPRNVRWEDRSLPVGDWVEFE